MIDLNAIDPALLWGAVIAAALLVTLLFARLFLRRSSTNRLPDAPAARPEGRLEPRRPEIEAAQRVEFAPPPPPVAAPLDTSAAERADLAADRPAIAPANGAPDQLSRMKGVGPKLSARLAELGVTRFDQIAAWTDADVAEVDRFLGTFQGRIARDNWVEQARLLAAGDDSGYAARFGAVTPGNAG